MRVAALRISGRLRPLITFAAFDALQVDAVQQHGQFRRPNHDAVCANFAALSVGNSNFKAWSIDDFVHNLKIYTPQYVTEFQDAAKKINPAFKFFPVCYYKFINPKFVAAYGSVIDGIIFPYRNESVKADLTDYSHVTDEINTLRNYFEKKEKMFGVPKCARGRVTN